MLKGYEVNLKLHGRKLSQTTYNFDEINADLVKDKAQRKKKIHIGSIYPLRIGFSLVSSMILNLLLT